MTSQKNSKAGVAVLVFPFAAPNVLGFAAKMTTVVSRVTAPTLLVGGGIPHYIAQSNGVQVRDIGVHLHYLRERQPRWFSAILWVCKALLAQILLAWEVFRLRREVDIVVCFMGSYYQLPILVSRLLGKKVLCTSWGSYTRKAKMNYGRIVVNFVNLSTRFGFALSQGVLVDSLRLGDYEELAPLRSRLYNGALFLDDPRRFTVQTPVYERENLVGFIGRLVVEKGIQEFIQAVPLVFQQRPDLQFLILVPPRSRVILGST